MDQELAGRVAIVSGAAQGIGEATARRLAASGARVVLGDVSFDKACAVAADIGDAAIATKLDVSKEVDWIEAMRLAGTRFGVVDVLVNNAGVMETTPLLDTTDAQFDRMLDVNLRGTFLGIRTVGGAMATALHQAVTQIPSEHPAGSVAQLFQSGWRIGDRTLRAAMVAVSAGGGKPN